MDWWIIVSIVLFLGSLVIGGCLGGWYALRRPDPNPRGKFSKNRREQPANEVKPTTNQQPR